jgi:hypothetical protein
MYGSLYGSLQRGSFLSVRSPFPVLSGSIFAEVQMHEDLGLGNVNGNDGETSNDNATSPREGGT